MAITKKDVELSRVLLDVIPQITRSIRGSMRAFTGLVVLKDLF